MRTPPVIACARPACSAAAMRRATVPGAGLVDHGLVGSEPAGDGNWGPLDGAVCASAQSPGCETCWKESR
jgi:hypothetical protein